MYFELSGKRARPAARRVFRPRTFPYPLSCPGKVPTKAPAKVPAKVPGKPLLFFCNNRPPPPADFSVAILSLVFAIYRLLPPPPIPCKRPLFP